MSRTAGEDLLFQDAIRDVVRRSYVALPAGAGPAVATRFYSPEELAAVPEQAVDWALGVGNPVRHAGLVPGERVLDVGCGGGIDSVLAARRVGPGGRVVGLDLLDEMCERARAAAATAGIDWCEFIEGEMEAIPLPDASVDVVISNGVLNLSPRKSRALAEIVRVLRPGGRLCFADLIVDGDLPPEVLASDAAWAGCIAGAVSQRVLTKKLGRTGFDAIDVSHHAPFGIDDVAQYPLFTREAVELMRELMPPDAQRRVAEGVTVRAAKPAAPRGAAEPPAFARSTELPAPAPASRARRPPLHTHVTPLDEIAPDAVEAPGVTIRHLKQVEDVELKVLDVEPGGSTPFHRHLHAHEGVLVSGSGALRLEHSSVPLRPGDVFSVRPNEPHAIQSDGSAPLRFVCMDCFVE